MPDGKTQNGTVVFIDAVRGYGYLRSADGKKVGISRKFIGSIFDKLQLDQEVRYVPNGRGGAESVSLP